MRREIVVSEARSQKPEAVTILEKERTGLVELEENWGDEYVAGKSLYVVCCMLIFSRYSSDRANQS